MGTLPENLCASDADVEMLVRIDDTLRHAAEIDCGARAGDPFHQFRREDVFRHVSNDPRPVFFFERFVAG